MMNTYLRGQSTVTHDPYVTHLNMTQSTYRLDPQQLNVLCK